MFTEDLSLFINADTPGYALATGLDDHGQAVSIGVLFDRPGVSGSVGEYGMASSQPVATLPTASVVSEPVGWALAINAVNYIVAAHDPDGTGISRLILEAA